MGNSLLRPVGAVENAFCAFSKDLVGALVASTGPAASTGRSRRRGRQLGEGARAFIHASQAYRSESTASRSLRRSPQGRHLLRRALRSKTAAGRPSRCSRCCRRAEFPDARHTRAAAPARAASAPRRDRRSRADDRRDSRAAAPGCTRDRSAEIAAVARGNGPPAGAPCLGFQHGMELLMRSILFRSPERDPFRHDPEAHPPDIQAREPAEGRTGERLAVIAANPVGQPIVAKRALEAPAGEARTAAEQRITPQHIAAEPVSQRQRIAVHPVARAELALEIGGPRRIRPGDRGQPVRPVRHRPSAAARHDHAVSPQQVADRRSTRPGRRRVVASHRRQQLFGSPARMAVPHPQQRVNDIDRGRRGVIMRSSRSIVQPARAGGLVTAPPICSPSCG